MGTSLRILQETTLLPPSMVCAIIKGLNKRSRVGINYLIILHTHVKQTRAVYSAPNCAVAVINRIISNYYGINIFKYSDEPYYDESFCGIICKMFFIGLAEPIMSGYGSSKLCDNYHL